MKELPMFLVPDTGSILEKRPIILWSCSVEARRPPRNRILKQPNDTGRSIRTMAKRSIEHWFRSQRNIIESILTRLKDI